MPSHVHSTCTPQLYSQKPSTASALPVVLLAGPTGVGKTALSLDLASAYGMEIVNADSMQVYRYMDIGTAKPSAEERARAPHHLIDIVDPDEPFDAARYIDLARPIVDMLHRRDKIPLVVGGTGLYMKALTRGICPGAPGDRAVREQLLRELEAEGLERLHRELGLVDPALAGRIHPNDRQRILRALEVYRTTGRPLSRYQDEHRFEQTLYRTVKLFLYRERDEIYERIERRVDAMIGEGFLDEVRSLLGRGFAPDLKPMQSLGYKQLAEHLLGRISIEEAVYRIKRDTRRYAKRQMTWFRADPEFQWVLADQATGATSRLLTDLRSRKGS